MPASNRKQGLERPNGQLGQWQDGAFRFDSPDAEKQWRIEAYRSGVHADQWDRGQVLDDKTRDLVLGGLGGPTAPVYRGPDGQYRFANRQTIEPADVRAWRQRSMQGVKLKDLKGPEMPGEEAIAATTTAPANDNPANDNKMPPANDNAPVAQATRSGLGRFAAMAAAPKEAGYLSLQDALQAIDDGVRLLANGATLGYADDIAAAGNALFGFGDIERNRAAELAKTEGARARRGKTGAVIEALPQMIPGYGDALGIVGDAKQYIEHPETATPGNILASIATALPITPNVLGTARKVEQGVEETAKIEAKTAEKLDNLPATPKAETEPTESTSSLKAERTRLDPHDPASVDAYLKRRIDGNEGPDGHVIEKHVGKTQEELLERLRKEPGIPAASTFSDYRTAETSIHNALAANREKIVNWVKASAGNRLILKFRGQDAVGFSVTPNGNRIERFGATVVLKKDGQGGFYFFTAFPSD